MTDQLLEKLNILGAAAKYDVSCSSSGSSRANNGQGVGNTVSAGICHSFTEDGRCISLLKILLTNNCIYDCAYCINRKSNDTKRATFSVSEVVDLTINFYRRNYIEGLFLSSGVVRNPDYTMERLAAIARDLRLIHKFNGYIHLKAIPGASKELIHEAGIYADRLSVNIEIPTEANLKLLAPDKNYDDTLRPMLQIKNNIIENIEERKIFRSAPRFAPGGQSTQLIIGASPENDHQILSLASGLYADQKLKRVYFSGYMPVNDYDKRLPALKEPPLVRENRLYQSDWLMRFYFFKADEIVNEKYPNLDLTIDPKLSYALRNLHLYPIDINKADYEMILRVPGIGVQSAKMIVMARRHCKLNSENLKKIGVVMKRAKYFITCNELMAPQKDYQAETLRFKLLNGETKTGRRKISNQLDLFNPMPLLP
ncbi:MAG: putative DNA modification/repair radical SAM protein [Bacteroidetes bacterium]|nr:putative DNA modification/repair radical SAM protein [Bacteroidota bacterium]